MAKEGLPKPQYDEVPWTLYISFRRSVDINHKYFEQDFYDKLKEIAPHWFSDRERRCFRKPKDETEYNRILQMAKTANKRN